VALPNAVCRNEVKIKMEVGLFYFLLSALLPERTPLVKNQAAANGVPTATNHFAKNRNALKRKGVNLIKINVL
jgi:hypothetical protein